MTRHGSEGLTLTGERTLPGIPEENYWFRRHEVAYEWAARFCAGAIVADAGCGEGYGTRLLASTASQVLGIDYLPDVCAHAAKRYPEIVVVRGDLQRPPLRGASLEVVVCLQVIEHLHDQPGFLRECARALRPAGTVVISTPNRLTFSPGSAAPVNPFHTRELAAAELRELLGTAGFVVTRLVGVTHGPRLRGWERRHGSVVEAQLARPPAEWASAVSQRVARTTTADFVVTDDTETALDLVAVAYRRP